MKANYQSRISIFQRYALLRIFWSLDIIPGTNVPTLQVYWGTHPSSGLFGRAKDGRPAGHWWGGTSRFITHLPPSRAPRVLHQVRHRIYHALGWNMLKRYAFNAFTRLRILGHIICAIVWIYFLDDTLMSSPHAMDSWWTVFHGWSPR